MASKECRACGETGARAITVNVSIAHERGIWRITVCRSCWRAFEALLDGAKVTYQPGLEISSMGGSPLSWLW